MTIDELTDKVITATRNNIYAKDVVKIHVQQGVYMMKDAGVDAKVAVSDRAIGFLCSYVTDVDNQVSGEAKLSSYTKSKLSQLVLLTLEDENLPHGALFVDFKCEEPIEAVLTIYESGNVKYSYRISRAVVEMLPIGEYDVELVFPEGYSGTSTEHIIVKDGEAVEIFKEVESDKVAASFSCKNTAGQSMSGYVFKFTNTETGEEYEFETGKEDKVIRLKEGSYMVETVYAPTNSCAPDDITIDIVKDGENVVEIFKDDEELITNNFYIYIHTSKNSDSSYTIYGTWYIKRVKTGETIKVNESTVENPYSWTSRKIFALAGEDYILEFEPAAGELVQPYSKQFTASTQTEAYLVTAENTGGITINVNVDGSKLSQTNASDIEEITVRFYHRNKGTNTYKTFKCFYGGKTAWYYSFYAILPAGSYYYYVEDIKSSEKTYKSTSTSYSVSVNSQSSQNSTTIKLETVEDDV